MALIRFADLPSTKRPRRQASGWGKAGGKEPPLDPLLFTKLPIRCQVNGEKPVHYYEGENEGTSNCFVFPRVWSVSFSVFYGRFDTWQTDTTGAYTACGGGAAYLWVAAASSVGSLFYVLAKAVAVFGVPADGAAGLELHGKGQLLAVEAMFLMSLAFAAAHLAMAYRASSREKRRLHVVYRIDIEAVRLKGTHTPKSLKQCIV
ncbi:hypothetical protein TRIUR3_26360 [Triticum urartu]|uniref:Uncharacterized protein n=1 Tax=Triticum urartu TaxID=4572 RepID=M7YSI0_TRIUA|nr:hypothetical protein TRIUR3_26360 [Triticum urartu]